MCYFKSIENAFERSLEEQMSYLKRLVASLVLVIGLLISSMTPSFANSYPGQENFQVNSINPLA